MEEWEELTTEEGDSEGEKSTEEDEQPPTLEEDPLAAAIPLDPKERNRNVHRTPLVRLGKDKKHIYISTVAYKQFDLDRYSYCDFLEGQDGCILVHLHNSPGRLSRQLRIDNGKFHTGGRVSCLAFANHCEWEPGQTWTAYETSRADVMKLVRVEQ